MNIWQLILVLLATFKFGAGIFKDLKSSDQNEKWGGIVASILVYSLMLFIQYKAGVLKL